MVVSYTFLELGEACWLHNIECWNILTTILVTKYLPLGFSIFLRCLLRHLLFEGKLSNLTITGIPLQHHNGEARLMYARLTNCLGDADGLRAAYHWKGFRGLRCCLKHGNVLAEDSDLAHRCGMVEITEADPRKFARTTPAEIDEITDTPIEMQRRVRSGSATKTRLEKLETAWGFVGNDFALLADRQLRSHVAPESLLDVATFDCLHCLLQDGIVVTETNCLLQTLGGDIVTEVKEFLQKGGWRLTCWRELRNRAAHLSKVFEDWRTSDDGMMIPDPEDHPATPKETDIDASDSDMTNRKKLRNRK